MTVSPFASFAASCLQQTDGSAKVKEVIKQLNILSNTKEFGTVSQFRLPKTPGEYYPSILVLSDAARRSDCGQLEFIPGLLLAPVKKGSVFHLISWSSHQPKRPAKSSASAEILAASEAKWWRPSPCQHVQTLATCEGSFRGCSWLERPVLVSINASKSARQVHRCRFPTYPLLLRDEAVGKTTLDTWKAKSSWCCLETRQSASIYSATSHVRRSTAHCLR